MLIDWQFVSYKQIQLDKFFFLLILANYQLKTIQNIKFSIQLGFPQCIGFYDYLGFGQIMKNKKYFKSKSNPNLKNSINFKSNHFKNVSNPNHFFKKPNPNQIQIQSNQIRKIMKNLYSKFCSLHIFWVKTITVW